MKFLKWRLERKFQKTSFAQCGEDLIVAFILETLGISTPRYVDIGAFHPVHFSNTYLFYRGGSTGVCVEPDAELHALHRRHRPRDICLNAGVGPKGGKATFFKMSTPTLSTFSPEEAARYEESGKQRITETSLLPLIPINSLLADHAGGSTDFLSLDTEGFELAILKSLSFDQFRPRVMCIETLTYDERKEERKLEEVIDYVKSQGYLAFADTFINTIFVEATAWRSR